MQPTVDVANPPPVAELNAMTYDRPLFDETSPWNQPARGAIDPLSDVMIENLAQWTDGRGFSVNTDRYAVPLFYADSNTPIVRILDSTGWWMGMDAPMPPEAMPDPARDGHLVVWDVSSDRLYEYWGAFAVREDVWCAAYGISFDASGTGIQTGTWEASARAYGGSAVAGAIRYGEMKRGVISHALAMAYPGVRGDRFARGLSGIASHSGNDLKPERTTDANIPLGARLRLKSFVDVVGRCDGNRGCEVIGRALQTYGTFVVDAGGAPVFYAENLIGKSVSWEGLLSPLDASTFVAEDFEVLELPPLTEPPPKDPSASATVMYDPPTECAEEP
jgi:hypothetical protein